MNQTVTIQQLHASPADTYVNGNVEGYLVQIRPPFGKGPYKAKLQEGNGTIDVSLWGGGVSQWEGKRVRFSGKGMKITEYKGDKQLSVGDKVLIEAAPQDSIPGDPAPRQPSGQAQTRPAPQPPTSVPQNRVNGQTVGMAINRGVEIWLATEGSGVRFDKNAVARVEEIALELVAMAQRIETGEPF